MVNELINALSLLKNQQIGISISHKDSIEGNDILDTTQNIFIDTAAEHNENLSLLAHNGSIGVARSNFNLLIPLHAKFTNNGNIWKIEYESQNKYITIQLKLPTSSRNSEFVTKESTEPTIREVKDKLGNLEQIYIDSPDSGTNIAFVQNIQRMLTQLLTAWEHFTYSSPDRTDDENRKIYEFNSINTVTLPGNVFFEIEATTENTTETLDIAPKVAINLKTLTISFELEGSFYKLQKTI